MAVAVTVPNKFVWSEWATMFMGYTGQGIELEKHCVFGCPHLSLLPSRSKSCGISTYRPSPLSTASQWITRETVGQLWKWSIVGRPPPPTSSVTVNFLSCKWKNGRRLPQLTSYQILSILSIVTDKKKYEKYMKHKSNWGECKKKFTTGQNVFTFRILKMCNKHIKVPLFSTTVRQAHASDAKNIFPPTACDPCIDNEDK